MRVVVFQYDSHELTELEAVVVHDEIIGHDSCQSLNEACVEVGVDEQSLRHEVLVSWSRHTREDVELGVFVGHRDARENIGSQINTENKHRGDRDWDLDQDEEQKGNELRNVGRHQVGDRLLQVVKHFSTLLNADDNRRKVII